MSKNSASDVIDVAIIGGGVSGVYSGWRLASAKEQERVELFELSDRIGGRLFSVVPEGMPNVRAEVGGMRYMNYQKLVVGLIETLGLPFREFPLGDENNLFYLRGHRFKESDFSDPSKIPYFLRKEEEGKIPRALLRSVIQSVAPGVLKMTAQEFQERKHEFSCDGLGLHEIGLWDLLERNLSIEAVNLIRDAAGYDGAVSNVNCADMIALALHHLGEGPLKEYTLVDGLDALPRKLGEKFVDQGGTVHSNHRLLTFHPEPDGTLRLLFKETGRDGVIEKRARKLILAMPQRSLAMLGDDCPLFQNRQFQDDLSSVVGRPASKIFLGYDRPWWRDLGITSGRGDTDYPLRQCYYFNTEGEQPGGDPGNTNSLLMAGYHDGNSVEFWSAFFDGKTFPHRLRYNPDDDLHLIDPKEVPPELIREAHRQVQMIHGIDIPEPYTALYMDWEQDPYGGAWHTWRVHVRSDEIMPRIRKPLTDLPVYICGEAFSQEQGWVQGALHTAEHVLQDHLGLSMPDFSPADHYLDP